MTAVTICSDFVAQKMKSDTDSTVFPSISHEVMGTDDMFLVYKCIYMEFRKMVMITLYERQQKRHRCIEQSFGLYGRGRGWDDLGEWH